MEKGNKKYNVKQQENIKKAIELFIKDKERVLEKTEKAFRKTRYLRNGEYKQRFRRECLAVGLNWEVDV